MSNSIDVGCGLLALLDSFLVALLKLRLQVHIPLVESVLRRVATQAEQHVSVPPLLFLELVHQVLVLVLLTLELDVNILHHLLTADHKATDKRT